MLTRSMHSRNQLTHQSKCVLGFLIVFLLFAAYESRAKERLHRMLDSRSGLPNSTLSGFAQDTNGFFWISTAAGLFRYDGTEFRRWAPDKLTGWHYMVYPAPDGEVFVFDMTQTLYHLLPNEDAEPVIGPEGKPFTNVQDAAFTRDGRFWVARQNALFCRTEENEWVAMPKEIPGTEKIWRLSASLDGSLLVSTTQSLWKVNPDLSLSRIVARSFNGYIGSAIAHPDGSIFYMEKYPDGGKIMQLRDGQITERLSLKTNLFGFVLRGQTVWANSEVCLVALREGQAPEILRAPEDIPGSGMMMVDSENSLWVGTAEGLMQIPEPETVVFNSRDGMPNKSLRYMVKTEEGIWIVTWAWGIGLFDQKSKKWSIQDDPAKLGWLAIDGKSTLWGHANYHDFYRYADGHFIKLLPPALTDIRGWSQAPDGTLWIASDRGLWRTESSPRFLGNPLGNGVEIGQIFEDSKGRLWLTSGEKIGYVSAADVASGREVSCSLQTLDGSRGLGTLIEQSNGSLWVGTQDRGVWRYTDEEGWKPIPASLKYASRSLGGFVRSPSGGVWVFGPTEHIRVIDRPDLPEGWQVVEELSDWQGIASAPIHDLIEEPDGDLWIASNGVIHMPAEVRHAPIGPPRVKLAALIMNGARVDLNSVPQVPPGHNQLEIHFAALSFRDRTLLRYQYRLHANDQWTYSASNVPVFRFFDLPAGKYSAEVRASLDGVNWSSETARIVFTVLPPWYLRWWSIALGVMVLGLALYAVHRARVAILLRLERQRTRIAMDLHDEIGSGLGSIGILSSVAASQNVGEDQRQEMTKRIAETAHELGASLTDIVWSLRADSRTLESLAYYLTRRAESLFANDTTQFTTQFPEPWPTINLPLTARRNVLLIAMESLHNAAKHAHAQSVILQFEPSEGHKWLMRIGDDGCGLGNGAGHNGSGMGMPSMRLRAEEIGAQISFNSKNERGTIVTLAFNPHAKERT